MSRSALVHGKYDRIEVRNTEQQYDIRNQHDNFKLNSIYFFHLLVRHLNARHRVMFTILTSSVQDALLRALILDQLLPLSIIRSSFQK